MMAPDLGFWSFSSRVQTFFKERKEGDERRRLSAVVAALWNGRVVLGRWKPLHIHFGLLLPSSKSLCNHFLLTFHFNPIFTRSLFRKRREEKDSTYFVLFLEFFNWCCAAVLQSSVHSLTVEYKKGLPYYKMGPMSIFMRGGNSRGIHLRTVPNYPPSTISSNFIKIQVPSFTQLLSISALWDLPGAAILKMLI